jgi:hypothetical protein
VSALAVLPALAVAARGSVNPGARWLSDHAMPLAVLTWPDPADAGAWPVRLAGGPSGASRVIKRGMRAREVRPLQGTDAMFAWGGHY